MLRQRGLVQPIRYDGDINENIMTQMKTVGQRKQHGNHTSRHLRLGMSITHLDDTEVAALAKTEGVLREGTICLGGV